MVVAFIDVELLEALPKTSCERWKLEVERVM
jgi:hypothetical protein